jgi:hypothetical protein
MVELTSAQERVVDHDGDLFLLACPGSGKTRAAAARVARLAEERRLAVCSYTNVGAHRIAKVLRDDFDTVLGPEHFLGTIHAFLLRYVLYPFAPLMSCKGRPHVREGEWPTIAVGGNQKKRIGVDAFRCAPDGSLIVKRKPPYVNESDEELIAIVDSQVRAQKRSHLERGILSFDDAIWWPSRSSAGTPISPARSPVDSTSSCSTRRRTPPSSSSSRSGRSGPPAPSDPWCWSATWNSRSSPSRGRVPRAAGCSPRNAGSTCWS